MLSAFSTRRSKLIEETDASADFLLLEKLGEGSFGKVYRAQQHSINRHVAIKVVPVAHDTGEVAREIDTLKECDSDNIVRCGPHSRPGTPLGAKHRCSHLVLPGPQVLRLLPARPRAMDCDGVLRRLLALRHHGGAPARVSMGAPPSPPAQPRCRAGCCKAFCTAFPYHPHCPHTAAAGHPPLLHRGADRRSYGGHAGGPHLPPPAQQDPSRHQGGPHAERTRPSVARQLARPPGAAPAPMGDQAWA